MKRSALVLFVIMLAVVLSGCMAVGPDTNRNAPVAAATPAKVDPAAIEAEILKLEREWMAAPNAKDGEAARRVVADDAVLIYPDGSVATKADEVRTIEAGEVTSDSFEMLESKVTVLDANAAYISGRSAIKNGKYKDPNTKKTIDISGEYRFLDVYAKRDGKWQVIASQATKIVAPPK